MRNLLLAFIALCSVSLLSCSRNVIETGNASYYADKFEGKKTASGATFHQRKLTAAHKTLPFGTKIKVTNVTTGKTVKVKVNDRGPFVAGRIIDLSKRAAEKIGLVQKGILQVEIKYRKRKNQKQ